MERVAQCRDNVDGFMIVDLGDELDVLRWLGDKAVRDHGSAPGKRHSAILGQGQRGSQPAPPEPE